MYSPEKNIAKYTPIRDASSAKYKEGYEWANCGSKPNPEPLLPEVSAMDTITRNKIIRMHEETMRIPDSLNFLSISDLLPSELSIYD